MMAAVGNDVARLVPSGISDMNQSTNKNAPVQGPGHNCLAGK